MQTENPVDPAALLSEHFGFSEFRAGQRDIIETLLNPDKGRALAVFPTGSGKSLCYQLPALALPGVTLVVSPLIALMKDQITALRKRGTVAARLDSSLTPQETAYANDNLRSGALKLLYVAPERFNNERFLEMLKRTPISLFAVDEAHCISEWGHNFRPDYLKLAQVARALGVPRVLALTATATPKVVQDICRGFEIPDSDAVVTGVYRKNLTVLTTPASPQTRDEFLFERLKLRPPGPTIVYVTLQKTAEFVASNLSNNGLPARAYHAGMEAADRTSVQEWWTGSDRAIAVATIAFGMGIDKANVRYVYHYNLPKSLENYSQEIGRAGRDDKPSIVEMFACADDLQPLENFAYGDTPTRESIESLLAELFSLGQQFDVSLYDLSARHDVRQAVLRTALTYLELKKLLRQGTPFYAGYEFRPTTTERAATDSFQGEYREFAEKLFRLAKKGKTWYHLVPDETSAKMQQPRQRIVRALEVMEERGLIELKVAELRHRFTRLVEDVDLAALGDQLTRRFEEREQNEVRRLRSVLDLVRHDGCQVNALCTYFGQERAEPCGHCTYCQTGKPVVVPEPRRSTWSISETDGEKLRELQQQHPAALAYPRQAARFLCGLTSPGVARARLGKNELFGKYEHLPFSDVLAWASAR